MPYDLKDLHLDEVSLVDEPANRDSRIVLFKRGQEECGKMNRGQAKMLASKLAAYFGGDARDEDDEERDDEMDEKARKQLDELIAKVAQVDSLVAKVDALAKENAALKAQAEKVSKHSEFRAQLPESVRKAFDEMSAEDQDNFVKRFGQPAAAAEDPIAKALEAKTKENEALAKRLEAIENERAIEKVRAELKDLEGMVKVDELAETVLTLRKSGHDAAAKSIVEKFRATKAQLETSGLFKELGRAGQGEIGAIEKVEALAKALRDKNPELTHAAAVAKVFENPDNAELYSAYKAERLKGA